MSPLLQCPYIPHGESMSDATRDAAGLVSSLQDQDINTEIGHSTSTEANFTHELLKIFNTDKSTADQHKTTVSPCIHANYTYIGLLSFISGNKSNRRKSY